MKKRFLAMLVAIAMLATIPAPFGVMAAEGEVTKTYFDIDFENWTNWGDNNFNGAKNSDGSAISHEWGAWPYQMSATTVSDRAGNVMQVNVPTSGGSNYLFRSRMRVANQPSSYSNVKVLWNEFSVKYEDGFAGFGMNENDEAKSIVSINKNGQLALGARWGYNEVGSEGDFDAGTIVPGGQLELDQWYDIKVAADFTDTSAGVLAYVWVNDELIAEGIVIPNFQSGTNWAYNKFYFDQAETACTAYIDDFKVYETAELGSITTPDEPDNTPVITTTYYDIDFENWTNWGDNSFNGAKQSNGDAITHEWGAWPYQMSATTVSDRAGNVMQVNVPTSGGSNYLFRSRMKAANQPSSYSNVKVLWNEFSVKYEDGFAGFGMNENDEAKSIVSINKNGQLALGARWGYNEVGSEGDFDAGTIVPGGQLELDQWYDIKVAADFTDTSAGVLAYVWVNDELIAEGIAIPNFQSGTNWAYNKFYFDQAETACTAYIDDFKVYETADMGGLITPDDPNPEPDPEPDPEPEIPVVPDIDNSDNKTTTYFDIDFENWTNWGDNSFNGAKQSDDTAITHEWGAWPYQMSATTVSDRAGNVMQVNVPTSGGSNYLFRSRMKAANQPSSYSNVKVLWNEFSVKYEGGFAGFGTNENDEAKSIISINKNGQLALGARWGYNEVGSEGDFDAGTIVPGGQLELDQWYNIAVAADFTDTSAGVLAYVWVNGELIAEGIAIPNFQSGTNWAYNKFYFDQAETACTAYIDDFEVYETAEVGNGVVIKEEINVMTEALNTITASIRPRNDEYHNATKMADGSKSGDDYYKSMKIEAEKEEGLEVVASLNAVYKISSVTVTERYMGDQGLTVTVEIGKNGSLTKVVDNQPVSTSGVTTYSFDATDGDTIVYTFKAATHRPEESDYQIYELEAEGVYVEDVAVTGFAPEIGFWYNDWNGEVEDIISYYITCYNAGDEAINGKFIIAAYEGNKLVEYVTAKDVTILKGANVISCTEKANLYNSNRTYKAILWEGLDTLLPVVKAVNIIK